MKNKIYIVCAAGYESPNGRIFQTGEVGEHCFGMPIPDGWREATDAEFEKWYGFPNGNIPPKTD